MYTQTASNKRARGPQTASTLMHQIVGELSARHGGRRPRPAFRPVPHQVSDLGDKATAAYKRLIKDGASSEAARKAVLKVAHTTLLHTLRAADDGRVEIRLHPTAGQTHGALVTTVG